MGGGGGGGLKKGKTDQSHKTHTHTHRNGSHANLIIPQSSVVDLQVIINTPKLRYFGENIAIPEYLQNIDTPPLIVIDKETGVLR